MLTFRRAQGGGRLQHVEPSWYVGDILSAGPYSGKQRRLSLAADWPGQSGPSSILEDNIVCSVGQLYPATGSETRMVISPITSRAASLE